MSDYLAFSDDNIYAHRLSPVPAPVLLCNAGYYGTLAAVRSLGRAGVPVATADPAILALGRYSRFVDQHLRCPPFEKTSKWAEWLVRLGRTGPRRVLLPTSDAVSFALARHCDELRPYFHLYQPDLDTIMCLLDKGRLLQHAHNAGFQTPETWLPESAEEAARIARNAGEAILIKPRSQLALRTYSKGVVIEAGAGDVRTEYDRMMRQGPHDLNFAREYPESMLPMLQRYHPESTEMVYSISGFRDVSGKFVVMRAARKILQRPRRLGVGLCFEEADLRNDLAECAMRLFESIGYFGVFEIEFIVSGGRALLIDFNGRLYNQVAFDIARGVDLPAIAYAAAIGNQPEMARLVSTSATRIERGGLVFCDQLGLAITMITKRALGKLSFNETNHWRRWRETHSGQVVDAVNDSADPLPAFINAAQQFLKAVRHPRAFIWQAGLE